MNLITLMLGAPFAATAASNPGVSHEFLINASFESGDFTGDITGWTRGGDLGFTSVQSTGYARVAAQNGNDLVLEGPVGSDSSVRQTFADKPGDTLSVTGWVKGAPSSNTKTSDFAAYFDGAPKYDGPPVDTNGWRQVSLTATAAGHGTVEFAFRDDPAFNAFDNFSVARSAIPESATWAMLGLGFAGLVFAGYRSRRTAISIE